MHVALVRSLAVQDPRPVVRLGRLGLHHRQLDVAEPHTAPLLGHVRQPEPGCLRFLAETDEKLDTAARLFTVGPLGERLQLCLFGPITSVTNVRTRSRMSWSSGESVKSIAITAL